MLIRTLLATSLALAFSSATALAQSAPPADPATAQTAPATDTATATSSDAKATHSKSHRRAHRHHRHHHHAKGKHHARHAADSENGMRIDHSADHLIVTPKSTPIPVPAGG